MSAIKRALSLATALLLLATGALAATGVRYSTVAVEKATFKRTTTLQGSILYLSVQSVSVNISGARLGRILVSPGDKVTAGDPVATYTLPTSLTDQKEKEVALREARDDYEYELAARTAVVDGMTAALFAETDETRGRILTLATERQKLADAKWQVEAEANIAALDAAFQAALTAGDEKTLYAGISGYVDSVAQLDAGTVVAGKALVVLGDPTDALVRVDDQKGLLKFGMEVDLRLSGYSSQASAKGVVVAADNVLPGELRGGYAYVAWDASATAVYTSAAVTAVTMYVEDVLVVPSQAVAYKDGRNSVEILGSDGAVRTRYVVKAMDDGSDAWIALGAAEGDKLITK
jgi:multidrug efflux pump subunit AcrA (membrane-fusion protein)